MNETVVSVEPSQLTTVVVDDRILMKHDSGDVRLNVNLIRDSVDDVDPVVNMHIRGADGDVEIMVEFVHADIEALIAGLRPILDHAE